MASKEVKKKRSSTNPSPTRKKGLKQKNDKQSVTVLELTSTREDIQEENTKDTGQEKDETSVGREITSESPPPDTIASPKYIKSPRDYSKARSSSPFRRNVVQPLDVGGNEPTHLGSATSLRSETSTRSKASAGSQDSQAWSKVDSISIKSEAFSEKCRSEQNAYIPYSYAWDCIARIVGDMNSMKTKHVYIVQEIEKHYRAIEDETQHQFNGFVMMLRQQYSGKVATFRQVIEVHRLELQRKEAYWNETLKSLTEHNNRLLKDRKVLLIHSKEEIEKMNKEKVVLVDQLTSQMDNERSSASKTVKEFEKHLQEKEEVIHSLEDENKRILDELEVEKQEVKKKEEVTLVTASPVATYEEQKQSEEFQQLLLYVNQVGEERHKLMDKIKSLQSEAAVLLLESTEWKEKYRLMRLHAGDTLRMKERFLKLENQYKALTLVVAASTDSAKVAQQEEEKVSEQLSMMKTEQSHLAKEIEQWEKEFRRKNGRDPTEEDKPDSVKELYIQVSEVSQMVESLGQQIETLQAVQSGTIPPVPELSSMVMPVPEPSVSVVEVMVPDPTILASLELSRKAEDDLQSRLAASIAENAELLAQIAALQAGAAGTVLNDDSEKLEKLAAELGEKEEELEQLRAENQEMSKDMKKMMRHYDKLQKKLADSSADSEASHCLQLVAALVHDIHKAHPDAGKEVEARLKQAQESVKLLTEKEGAAKKALKLWEKNYKRKHGVMPEPKDRDEECQLLHSSVEDITKTLRTKELEVQALTLLHTGHYSPPENKKNKSGSMTTPETDIDQQLSALEDKIIDLEGEKEKLEDSNKKQLAIIDNLEQQVLSLKERMAGLAQVTPLFQDTKEVSELEAEVNSLQESLQQEQAAHELTRQEMEALQVKVLEVQEEVLNRQAEAEATLNKVKAVMEGKLTLKEEQLAKLKKKIEDLEKERLANIPLDTSKEIKNLQNQIALVEKEKEELQLSSTTEAAGVTEMQTKLQAAVKALEAQRAVNRDLESRVKAARSEKDKAVKELTNQLDKKKLQTLALENKIKQLQAAGAGSVVTTTAVKASTKAPPKGSEDSTALKQEIKDLNARIQQLETEARRGSVVKGAGAETAADKNLQKRHEKILKELGKKLEAEQRRNDALSQEIKERNDTLKAMEKENKEMEAELEKLREELAMLGVAAKEGAEAASRVKFLEAEVKQLIEENRVLTENYNSERVLRKKYYNMVEDMKGKIRVYCRARPLSSSEKERGNHSIVKSPDEYTIQIASQRGLKEFQFDQIFMEDVTQERVFEDTHNLIQSAVDGYNVCIFAYGQTGSGKTFTMIGDRDQNFPGVAPRAFKGIFELAQENKAKFDMSVSAYMLELYNDKLIDLFAKPGSYEEDKLEIKKDKKGMVFIQGAAIKAASNAKELLSLFEEGSKNRHTASTKMNSESSRSHLVIGIVMESTNKATGTITKGKLSLVDLAGSERVGKTGATAEQLKEAMSINKSLSALGDVISALSSEQSFIPYRNSKLTMLMQDSLGGNAKTLMFVNVSPADYNMDETVTSLTYASRVKLITNDASKNADNKEIARLKSLIAKLKAGEKVEEEEA
ncbi:hypothetical protein C0Q70_20379 [Pomacea canaliculata]|uniref:Kinesin motor domain-containing protein n=1 Tax=Pomacea canaliculata TaxID=400727 RepID=A0A2T7NFF2_POMCA|nr:hypothetical protein C0Q70_20379 [Pomacea canaliculata]